MDWESFREDWCLSLNDEARSEEMPLIYTAISQRFYRRGHAARLLLDAERVIEFWLSHIYSHMLEWCIGIFNKNKPGSRHYIGRCA